MSDESEWKYSVEDVEYVNTEAPSRLRQIVELVVAIFFVLLTLVIIFSVIQSGGSVEYSQIGFYLVSW